jgi:hypothetical protein
MRKENLWLNLGMKSGIAGGISHHLNDSNTKLQGRQKLISDTFRAVRRFEVLLEICVIFLPVTCFIKVDQ